MARPAEAATSWKTWFFSHPTAIYTAAAALRLGLLAFGIVQDQLSAVRYTDIDYFVFTDAARNVNSGLFAGWSTATSTSTSPYDRATYRYTPLLAWLLVPTAWQIPLGFGMSIPLFSIGKLMFAAADLLVGWLIVRLIQSSSSTDDTKNRHSSHLAAAVWLLNPIVATISTRGSAEAVLAVTVTGMIAAVASGRNCIGGLLLGLSVHLKLYPFIYAPAILLWLVLRSENGQQALAGNPLGTVHRLAIAALSSWQVYVFSLSSIVGFAGLSGLMYAIYGLEFVEHSYLYHLVRIDHRHNFSVYNTALHLTGIEGTAQSTGWSAASLAFVPQLVLSAVVIPAVLLFAHSSRPGGPRQMVLPAVMFVQTFAFVTFNKVCTSQYFIWYINLLPFFLAISPPTSTVFSWPVAAVVGWVAGQAMWLWAAYNLEFLGQSSFVPHLWIASLGFFAINCGILAWTIDVVGR